MTANSSTRLGAALKDTVVPNRSQLPMPNLPARRQFGFTPAELRNLRALKTPAGIQRFLHDLPYHLAGTAWSPRNVLRKKTALASIGGATFSKLDALLKKSAVNDPSYDTKLTNRRATEPIQKTRLKIKSPSVKALEKNECKGCRHRGTVQPK